MRSWIAYSIFLLSAVVFAAVYPDKSISFLLLYPLAMLPVLSLATVLPARALIRVRQELGREAVFKNEECAYTVTVKNRFLFPYPRLRGHVLSGNLVRYEGEPETEPAGPGRRERWARQFHFPVLLPRLRERGAAAVVMAPLKARGRLQWEYRLHFPYRGVYPVGFSRLEVTDFLGLFRVSIPVRPALEVVVYPQLDQGFGVTMRSELQNSVFSFDLFNEDYTAVADVRKYEPSDTLRKIHWKLSAKRGDLMVKNFQSLEPNYTMLCLDSCRIPLEAAKAADFADQMASHVAAAIDFFQRSRMTVDVYQDDAPALRVEPEDALDKALRALAQVSFNRKASALPGLCRGFTADDGPVNLVVFLFQIDDAVAGELREFISLGNELLVYHCASSQLPCTPPQEAHLEALRACGGTVHNILLH